MSFRCKSKGCQNRHKSREGYCEKHRDKRPQRRFNKLLTSAKKRGLEVKINKEEYKKLILGKRCYYCSGEVGEAGYGLDRLDNQLGYTLENAVPCCGQCNTLKSDVLTSKETQQLIKHLQKIRKVKQVWRKNHQTKRRP